MDVENLAKELILKNMTPEQQMAVLDSVRSSVAQAKEVQKRKIGENVDLVVQALKKIESDIRSRFDDVGNAIEKRVSTIKDGRDGINGKDGQDGKDGKSGKDGLKGDKGADGQAGRDGVNGVDGISVVNANIDFDGSLIISLSDGREINVGEVVSADVAEKIKVISTMSTNAAIAIKDEGSTITSSVKNINFVGAAVTATNSGDDVTINVSSGTGTVTSVAATGGTGISVSGSPITTTGTLTITNTAPDQTVALTQGGTTTITGTYPNFTISSADQFQGTVTSVTGTSPVASSGGATPAISLAANYGDTQNPYASKTANFVLAAPNGSAGAPTFRAVVAADIPTLNQSTTGSAATLTTARAIYGNNFDGSAALTQVIASTYGGTGNGFTKFTGATTAEKTYTLPDASSTIVVQGGALGTPSSGTVTNLTGTASININGTVGATTPAAGTFTSLSDSGNLTFTGTGNRITGDFSNATIANRVFFQSSTTNGSTNVSLIPNGTGTFSGLNVFANSDTTNTAFGSFGTRDSGTNVSLRSEITGTGTYLPMTFYTGGSERARIDTSGNVGIGTTTPATSLYKLTLAGDTGAGSGVQIRSDSGTGAFSRIAFTRDSTDATTGLIRYSNSDYSMQFFTANGTTNGERMRIDSSGNVGIGTSSPSTKLQVNGQTRISDGTTNIDIVCASTVGYMGTQTNAPLVLRTNDTERMRIDTSGNLLVGTTSTSATSGVGFKSIINDRFAIVSAGSTGATTSLSLYSTGASAFRFFVQDSGNINATSTSITAISDISLKENVRDLETGLTQVMALKPRRFDWKSETHLQEKNIAGFIAQEVEQVLPELVYDYQYNATEIKKSLKMGDILPTLVKAIQEQQALIQSLTTRITALEAK
jgi:hypothetical protein